MRFGGEGQGRPVTPRRCLRRGVFGRRTTILQVPVRNAQSRSHSDVLCFPQMALSPALRFGPPGATPGPAAIEIHLIFLVASIVFP